MTQLSALLTPPTVGLYLRFVYIATASQTSFSGADSIGLTLNYKPGYIQVALNGLVLPASDYTATTGTSIVFGTGLTAGDVVDVTAWSVIAVGDVLVKSLNGADVANTSLFRSNIGIGGSTGQVGERVANSATLTFAASATAGVVTSIPLTAGTWDIEMVNQFTGTGATSSSDWVSSISTTSGSAIPGTSLSQASTYIHTRLPSALDQTVVHNSPRLRIAPGTTTTYYLNAIVTYSGSYSVTGVLQATRIS